MSATQATLRLGIDLGGTKIEGLVVGADNAIAAGPVRMATPRQDYDATLDAICSLITQLRGMVDARSTGAQTSIGVAMPGSIMQATGLVQNANSTWLNQRPLQRDLETRLGQSIRLANDANCFALSEAIDGAAAGAASVFGVILGTGCGGGIVVDGRLVAGALGIGGEWGHNPLPWPQRDEWPGRRCWCGRLGCMETWVSGPALEALYAAASGEALRAADIAAAAAQGNETATDALKRHCDRLARGLAHVMNIVDPEVIVLGGGLSKLDHLYELLPDAIAPHLFTGRPAVDIRRPKWGDSSGVRGAAWLWNEWEAGTRPWSGSLRDDVPQA